MQSTFYDLVLANKNIIAFSTSQKLKSI